MLLAFCPLAQPLIGSCKCLSTLLPLTLSQWFMYTNQSNAAPLCLLDHLHVNACHCEMLADVTVCMCVNMTYKNDLTSLTEGSAVSNKRGDVCPGEMRKTTVRVSKVLQKYSTSFCLFQDQWLQMLGEEVGWSQWWFMCVCMCVLGGALQSV